MQITLQKASADVVTYLGRELEKIPNTLQRFATMFAVGAMGSNPDSFKDKARQLGILTHDGMVDTDLVRSGFAMAFANGNTLEAFGMRFSMADGNELLRMLES